MLRATFYVDGYNLYCGLKAKGLYKQIWLNLEELCRRLVDRRTERLGCVKYFTAVPRHDPAKALRHETYLAALRLSAARVEIVAGNFKEVSVKCKVCGAEFRRWEEKRTDVAIAAALVHDAHQDAFDCAYIVSADSDLIPAIEIVKSLHPAKKIGVWFPPGRHSFEVRNAVSYANVIPDRQIVRCQFPEVLVSVSGLTIHKPAKWS